MWPSLGSSYVASGKPGSWAALPGRGGPARCLDVAAQAWLGDQVVAQPDATLAELQTLLVERGQAVSRGSG